MLIQVNKNKAAILKICKRLELQIIKFLDAPSHQSKSRFGASIRSIAGMRDRAARLGESIRSK